MGDKSCGNPVRYLASAPVRVDFAGGWTDVPVFAERHGGVVVNAAVQLRVQVEVTPGGGRISLHATDIQERVLIFSPADIRYDGKLDLHKAALNMLPVTGGVEILSSSQVPAGSGLGASGALDVALVAALTMARMERIDVEDIAELGYMLEHHELGLLGGRQDQYAAALGGVSELTFKDGRPIVRRLELPPETLLDLERHLVIVYTGRSHFSSLTHEHVWDRYKSGDQEVLQALQAIREAAGAAAGAIEQQDWEALAEAVNANWHAQRSLHPTIATEGLIAIESVMRDAGALGVKATGAGAGGCLVAIVPPGRRSAVIAAAVRQGGRVLESKLDTDGCRTWTEERGPDSVE